MKSTLQADLSTSTPIQVCILPCQERSGEISLSDLGAIVVRRKYLLLLSFMATLILASGYLFLKVKLYQADTHLLPPQQKDVQDLIVGYQEATGAKAERYSPIAVFQSFQSNLHSSGVRRQFFDSYGLVKHYSPLSPDADVNARKVFDQIFNQRIHIQATGQDKETVTVSFSDKDPKVAAQWLNQFVHFVNEKTIQQLHSDVETNIKGRIRVERDLMESRLISAKQRKQDKLVRLQEALGIAKKLKIEKSMVLQAASVGESANEPGIDLRAPLYTRGIQALEAEITALKARESDDAFVGSLRNIQERISFLERLSVDPETLSAVAVDAPAAIPYQVAEPNYRIVLVLSVVIGLVVSILMILVAELTSKSSRPQNHT